MNKLTYHGQVVTALPETLSGDVVDIITADGKRHVAVPLSALDTVWED